MRFDLPHLSEPVRTILEKYSSAVVPLARSAVKQEGKDDAQKLRAVPANELFRGARQPEAALSGLLLLMNCWEESHNVSQEIPSSDGSYWHGIAHRIEPDSFNAGYWFRRTGRHPVFPQLYIQAQRILEEQKENSGRIPWRLKSEWDPFLFIEWCDEARAKPGSPSERTALLIQQEEWRLLFLWCASLPTEATR